MGNSLRRCSFLSTSRALRISVITQLAQLFIDQRQQLVGRRYVPLFESI
jgi:hypothetical protein